MESEKNLSHDESLRLIHSMIEAARNRITENGFHFLLWGILVITASLLQYAWIKMGGGNQTNIVWIIMPAIGVPAAFIYEWFNRGKQKVKSINEEVYNRLWLGFGITLFLAITASVMNKVQPMPFILMIVGLATFVSGCLYRFAPLILGGVVFWLGAVATLFFNGSEMLLINAGATFLGYIIPGVLLWKNHRAENNV